jgi:hypothetical protein
VYVDAEVLQLGQRRRGAQGHSCKQQEDSTLVMSHLASLLWPKLASKKVHIDVMWITLHTLPCYC